MHKIIYLVSGCAIFAFDIMFYTLCWQMAQFARTLMTSGYVDIIFHVNPMAHVGFAAVLGVCVFLWYRAFKKPEA